MLVRDKFKKIEILYTMVKRVKQTKQHCLFKYNYLNKLKKDFKDSFGYELDLTNPKTFNEKIQWLKVNYRKPILTVCADKYAVREYVKEIVGEKYLIDLYGVYDSPDEIDFDQLPSKFVLKPNHSAGRVIICLDKTKMNWKKECKKMHSWMKENYYYETGEWQYKDIKPKILCEKLLQEDIVDYKIFCFNGEPRFIQVISNRNGQKYNSDYHDLNWSLININRKDHGKSEFGVSKPTNFEKMLEISKEISKEFPFVRMDFYEVEGNLYFGETTFTPGNGFIKFEPKEYDRKFGDLLDLPEVI